MAKQFELDHVFILTDVGAPGADKLVEFGLVEGPPNTHPGQGTANRRFFFKNAMLELLWVADVEESKASDLSVLCDRAHQPEVSPFGICLRPVDTPPEAPPFSGWRYTPSYLPAPLHIWVGQNFEALTEPFMFYLYFAKRRDSAPAHSHGLQTVNRLNVIGCEQSASEVLPTTVENNKAIQFFPGDAPLMELGFNSEPHRQSMDFRPHLPLRLCW